MIFFLCHDPSNKEFIERFGRVTAAGGEQVHVYHEPPVPLPSTLALKHIDIDADEISGYEKFRWESQPPGFKGNACNYALSPDELDDVGRRWFAHYVRELDVHRQLSVMNNKSPLTQVVTWGSSHIGNRACIKAAEYFDIPVSVLEFGFFRNPDHVEIEFCVAAERAYYERHPFNWWIGREEFEHQPERMERYRDWWKSTKTTKFSGSQIHSTRINEAQKPPPAWTNQEEPRILWAGQVHHDAAMFWGVPEGAKEQLRADALEANAWLKPHPFAFRYEDEEAGYRVLPADMNIHQVLPEADQVWGMTTNVLLEAWLYDKQTRVYGEPFFAGIAPEDHMAFLDYVIYEVQFGFDKPWKFVEKLKESEAWQRAKKTETAEAVA